MGYLTCKFSQLQLCRSSDEIIAIKVEEKIFWKTENFPNYCTKRLVSLFHIFHWVKTL